MIIIGCHLSSSKGYLAMAKEAVSIGANTFQFFTRNPRGGKAKAIDPGDVKAYNDYVATHNFGPVIAHASYTLNPASSEKRLQNFVHDTLVDDFERLALTPGAMYNLHPGNSKDDREGGIKRIIEILNKTMKKEHTFPVLLETMAGKGSEVGGVFEELRTIIDNAAQGDRIGVTLDTCHVFDSGYDIVNDLDGVLKQFDKAIGLERLKAIHLNDSKNTQGSHKDRHEKLGDGNIGIDAFSRIINHEALRSLPFCLETPNDIEGYAQEIALLKSLYKE